MLRLLSMVKICMLIYFQKEKKMHFDLNNLSYKMVSASFQVLVDKNVKKWKLDDKTGIISRRIWHRRFKVSIFYHKASCWLLCCCRHHWLGRILNKSKAKYFTVSDRVIELRVWEKTYDLKSRKFAWNSFQVDSFEKIKIQTRAPIVSHHYCPYY